MWKSWHSAAVAACLFLCTTSVLGVPVDKAWWRNALVYQIYPRSFMDSNGDGIGDLNGITSRLEHLKDIGVDALWMSPIYPSPQKDFGYDISNFTDINPEYGTLADFAKLSSKAKSLSLKVMMDFVPNHSSDLHPWFQQSIKRVKPYDDYYVWKDGKVSANGTRQPPNNWLSAFSGSAWEWNDVRKQYYYHQFVKEQPDLNYTNPALRQKMMNAFLFWLERGVDGFRVDAINTVAEDPRFLDEPRSGLPVPSNDSDYLDHIYTQNQDYTYEVVQQWRMGLDKHATEHNQIYHGMLTEAYAPMTKTMKYYYFGSTPFNFYFITDLNAKSTALDMKRTIDGWMNNMPKGEVANWVTGNHDQHRVATRFGPNREDQTTILAMMLPGITVVYNGDEIGMLDRNFTYKETVDPAGCNAGPDRYQIKSRDPQRTPYQWDATKNAGFSTANKTWLPINDNYKTLNLAAQKPMNVSHYKVFKALSALKKTEILKRGTLEVLLATEKVLAVIRRLPERDQPAVALINTASSSVTIDARSWLNIPERMRVHTASVKSGIMAERVMDTTRLVLPGAASIVLAEAP